MRALEDFGPNAGAQEMGETLLNYLGDQRGTFWWGGYGVSTEHTAYINLANGIPAPHSGSAARSTIRTLVAFADARTRIAGIRSDCGGPSRHPGECRDLET